MIFENNARNEENRKVSHLLFVVSCLRKKKKHYFVELYISVFLQHHKTKLWCCGVLRRYKMGILHCVKRVCIRAGKYVPEKL